MIYQGRGKQILYNCVLPFSGDTDVSVTNLGGDLPLGGLLYRLGEYLL